MKEEPWWSAGLHFKCESDCGRCCSNEGGLVFLEIEDARRISNYEGLRLRTWARSRTTRSADGRIVLGHRSDGACTYLNPDQSCKIYEVKPTQCSAFPWWQENLRNEISWGKVKADCPGIDANSAPLISMSEIRKWVSEDRRATRGFRRMPRS